MQTTKKRWAKGSWMTLKSVDLLVAFMTQKDYSGARLARAAGCSRQFIWQLLKGQKKSMKPLTAVLIAEALDVPLQVLFVPSVATVGSQTVKRTVAA